MTVKQTVEITNKLGMHARPAMKLFELMQNFDAEVLLRNDEGTEAEANSVDCPADAGLGERATDRVEASGPQEVEALAAVIALFNAGLTKTKRDASGGGRLAIVPARRRSNPLIELMLAHEPFPAQLSHLA
ncbi:PTS phosphocarrier protein NPr [Klebsiella pneumoniae subsp. pneumoniae]|nr:PTS phosphocarrier protein NPr [Klebsiella pneumoniae subsp. pneumoniae]